jgi:hypothetical protein
MHAASGGRAPAWVLADLHRVADVALPQDEVAELCSVLQLVLEHRQLAAVDVAEPVIRTCMFTFVTRATC